MGSWPHGIGERADSQCCRVSTDSPLQADRSDSGDRDPGDVHTGYGQDAGGHTGASDHHRPGARMGFLDVRSPVGHSVPGCSLSIPVGNRERQRGRRSDPKSDGSKGGIYAGTTTGGTRQCGSPSRLGGVMETKGLRDGSAPSSRWRSRWRSESPPRRGRSGRPQRKKLSESRSGKNT